MLGVTTLFRVLPLAIILFSSNQIRCCAAKDNGIQWGSYSTAKFGELALGPRPSMVTDQKSLRTRSSIRLLDQTLALKDTTHQVGNIYQNKGFVKASGTRFTVNDEPFYCSGTNAFYAALEYIMSEDEVTHMMKEHADRGVTVLRLFMSFFDSVPNSMMPSFGEYNEEALQRLDSTLVEMAQNGIRAILVLSNYWPFLGGFSKWVEKAYPGQGKPLEEFYNDDFVKSEFKKFISMLINRRNTLTGVLYRDDPTIFAFELANEPRAKGYDTTVGKMPGETICSWAQEMTAFIRSQDSNHMVSIGDEGMRANGSNQEPHSWINNGYEGVDFVCNLQYADFATIHAYPDAWAMSADDGGYKWLGDNYFRDRRDIAHSMNKPIILEEYGMRRGYLPQRKTLFDFIHQQVVDLDYSCSIVWGVSHEPTTPYQYGYYGYNDGQGYVFGYTGDDTDGSDSVVSQYKVMSDKTQSNAGASDDITIGTDSRLSPSAISPLLDPLERGDDQQIPIPNPDFDQEISGTGGEFQMLSLLLVCVMLFLY
jgi:hypothetical protein